MKFFIITFLTVIIGWPFISQANYQIVEPRYQMMDGWGVNNMMWGGGLAMLFWLLVVVGFIWLVSYLVAVSHNPTDNNCALDILQNRYAKGEIDKQEFLSKKRDLIKK